MQKGSAFLSLCTALTAAVLLTAPALATHKPGHNPPGQMKKGMGGGPPPWAPAHGYRANQGYKFLQTPRTGWWGCNRETVGMILGGAAGTAVGSQIGKGDGKTVATIGGAVLGVLIGGSIGRMMDDVDQNCLGQVLEQAPTGKPVSWPTPNQQGQYQVTPTRTFESTGGQACREYQMKVVIGGKEEDAYATACRQADGSWKRVSG